MKPPKPTEGVAKHCWGKRRRITKKTEKGIWKALDRMGLLDEPRRIKNTAYWSEGGSVWWQRQDLPAIFYASSWRIEPDDLDARTADLAHSFLDAPLMSEWDGESFPPRRAKDDRHALQLLRQELRNRKRRHLKGGKEGGAE